MPAVLAYPLFSVGLGALGTVTVTIGTVATVAMIGGSILYARQQAMDQQKAMQRAMAANQGFGVTSREPAAAQRIIYGTSRVGGTIVYMGASGTTNKYLHLVIALAGHEVNDITEIYFDDVLVPLDGSGDATAPSSGTNYTGFARVKKHLGTTTQTADADLVSEMAAEWTSAHRLQGIAYIYVRLKYDANKFSSVPNITAIVQGKKVYDPRTATTVFSNNSALCVRDYMMDARLGLGCVAGEIDDASVIAAANICDENVLKADSTTEHRYACDGVVETTATPSGVIEDLLTSMAGWATYTGGLWSFKAGAHQDPSETFTIDDLRGEISVQTAESSRDACNGVKGTYISNVNKWQPADFPSVKNATYIAEDGGVKSWRDINLAFTISPSMAQRIAKIELERSRQDITVKMTVSLKGARVKAGDVVALTIDRYGWNQKLFEVTNWKFRVEGLGFDNQNAAPTLVVDMELRETAAGVWDWSSGEETVVDLAPNTNIPSFRNIADPTALSVNSDVVLQSDGTIVSRLLATWTAPLDGFVLNGGSIVINYKLASDSVWSSAGTVEGDAVSAQITAVNPGATYQVRIRSQNPENAFGAWVVSGSVIAAGDTTAPSIPSGVTALGIYQGMRLRWTNPTETDLAFVEIFEASASTPAPTGGSTPYARVYGTEFIRQGLNSGDVRYYWLRSADNSGNLSAWTASPVNATAQAVSVDAASLTGTIVSTQIADDAITTPKLLAGSVTANKVGTNEIITTAANIANAVITSAKIADLAADKLTAGTISSKLIQIGGGTAGVIQSDNFSAGSVGWRIRGNGDAEFNSITVRVSNAVSATGATGLTDYGAGATVGVCSTPSQTWLARAVNVGFACTVSNFSGTATVWDVYARIVDAGGVVLGEMYKRYTVSGGAVGFNVSLTDPVTAGAKIYYAQVYAKVWSGGSVGAGYVLAISSGRIVAEQITK